MDTYFVGVGFTFREGERTWRFENEVHEKVPTYMPVHGPVPESDDWGDSPWNAERAI